MNNARSTGTLYGVKYKNNGWILTSFFIVNGIITKPQAGNHHCSTKVLPGACLPV
jgi:hypothetical protein